MMAADGTLTTLTLMGAEESLPTYLPSRRSYGWLRER